jgi:hypothetical protein
MAPPLEIFNAVLAGDVVAVRFWLTSGTRDLSEYLGLDEAGEMLPAGLPKNTPPPYHTDCTLLHVAVLTTANSGRGSWCPRGTSDEAQRDMVRLLLEFGADVNALDTEGREPPLTWCANPLAFAALLEVGADINARNCVGHVALSLGDPIHGLTCDSGPMVDRPADFLTRLKQTVKTTPLIRYYNEPRVQLMLLRQLCDRGRATPPPMALSPEAAIFDRLFGMSPRTIPKEVLQNVLSYWRTNLDDDFTFKPDLPSRVSSVYKMPDLKHDMEAWARLDPSYSGVFDRRWVMQFEW